MLRVPDSDPHWAAEELMVLILPEHLLEFPCDRRWRRLRARLGELTFALSLRLDHLDTPSVAGVRVMCFDTATDAANDVTRRYFAVGHVRTSLTNDAYCC